MVGSQASVPSEHKEKFMEISNSHSPQQIVVAKRPKRLSLGLWLCVMTGESHGW